jgi:predicted site-specific integrase-resolvase
MTLQRYIKLSDYANKKAITYTTAWTHFKKGLIKGAFKDESGHVLIPIHELIEKKIALYSRVSSNEMKENLTRQENRLKEYANRNNYTIVKSVKEIGSGMNDNRPKLISLLNDDSWNILLIENKDRLTRFGFNYIKTLLEQQGKKIILINEIEEDNHSLMDDLISIIYSFSARIYGLRRKKNKEDIIKFLES